MNNNGQLFLALILITLQPEVRVPGSSSLLFPFTLGIFGLGLVWRAWNQNRGEIDLWCRSVGVNLTLFALALNVLAGS